MKQLLTLLCMFLAVQLMSSPALGQRAEIGLDSFGGPSILIGHYQLAASGSFELWHPGLVDEKSNNVSAEGGFNL